MHAMQPPWYWNGEKLFDDVDSELHTAFLKQAAKYEYRKTQHVFLAGDSAARVFFLHRGTIRIYDLSALGDPVTFWFCTPGSLFGMDGVYGNPHQMFFAQAIEPSTAYAISCTAFNELIAAHPELAMRMVQISGARLRLACEALVDLASHSVATRLARLLLRLQCRLGKPNRAGTAITMRISHTELANMIGACRQTVNRELNRFREEGWIDFDARSLIVFAPEKLHSLADNGRASHTEPQTRHSTEGVSLGG